MTNSIKLKLALAIFEWFLYFRIGFMVQPLILSKKVSLFEYLIMSRFYTMFGIKRFEISAVCRSVVISSPFSVKWILVLTHNFIWEKRLTVPRKTLLFMTDFSSKFSKYIFLIYFKRDTNYFFKFHKTFYFPRSYFAGKYYVI